MSAVLCFPSDSFLVICMVGAFPYLLPTMGFTLLPFTAPRLCLILQRMLALIFFLSIFWHPVDQAHFQAHQTLAHQAHFLLTGTLLADHALVPETP